MKKDDLTVPSVAQEKVSPDNQKRIGHDLGKTLELIRDATLMDDFFFKRCFQKNIPAAELTIKIILGNEDLKVVDLKIEQDILSANPAFRSIRMDALAKDSEGRFFNIEIQKAEAGADVRRARYYSAMMDSRMLKAKQPFKELKDSYMIFFTEGDYFEKGLPLYEIDRFIIQDGSPFGDGSHIIYVNGANKDIETSLGKLVHDFKCPNPDEFYYTDLRDSVSHFKTIPKGVSMMSQTFTEYANEIAEEYGRKCRAEGEAIGRAKAESAYQAAEKAYLSELELLRAENARLKALLN